MTKLSVNINKVATLRNARGGNVPDVCRVALDCEKFGADGITVHPRPDERHIRYSDVRELRPLLTTEFNIEGYPSPEFVKLVLEVRPCQATLVPDPPTAITSNAGWNTVKYQAFLQEIAAELKQAGIRVSIFVGAENLQHIEYAARAGANRVELYTEPYAKNYATDKFSTVKSYVEAANLAKNLALGVNAGHDLNLENLAFFKQSISTLDEVSIGHALIADALYLGLEETIKRYKEELKVKN